jgi:carbamoyltransferase
MFDFECIPEHSVLGLNYSGMHDSAIAVVAPDGEPLFAASLERISRVKQDGRPPYALLEGLPWERIDTVCVSTPSSFVAPQRHDSRIHPMRLAEPRSAPLLHGPAFHAYLDTLPREKAFVAHQLSHAASAFWGSEFDDALCLTYDGGMSNDPYFGGLFRCTRKDGIHALDQFSAMHYAKVTSLYTFVTALLGFAPNKHEGKITGLAAYGTATGRCHSILERWFDEDYLSIESCLRWVFAYSDTAPPRLVADFASLRPFHEEVDDIPREELAASVQHFAERHVLEILANARSQGWKGGDICLAGGLFANVKINQRVAEAGFDRVFVAPPMTDDGTALGAAWNVLSGRRSFRPRRLRSMFLGATFPVEDVERIVFERGIRVQRTEAAADAIAGLLAQGQVVAVYQGASEYGPRALGNRSVLAPASDPEINRTLNERLNRTEFMPFAPISRVEDARRLYHGVERVTHAAEFMTVTMDCTDQMKAACPAVVHVDGTARPQLVSAAIHPLIHAILTRYQALSGRPALVNTSFNIHEEPIVWSPEDALRGFFESGLDHLYLGGVGLVALEDNAEAALAYLQERMKKPSAKERALVEVNALLAEERSDFARALEEKEEAIQALHAAAADLQVQLAEKDAAIQALHKPANIQLHELTNSLREKEAVIQSLRKAVQNLDSQQQMLAKALQERESAMQTVNQTIASPQVQLLMVKALEEKEAVIQELNRAVEAYRSAFSLFGFLIWPLNFALLPIRRLAGFSMKLMKPRLGTLNQHEPRQLSLRLSAAPRVNPLAAPKISIVTPSFKQAGFIERTLRSVLDQQYPNLEYVVQDGGSEDGTREILERYAGRLAAWESRADAGQAEAINRGFAKTGGEIMAWLNSDDILLPGALAYVADFFTRHPEIDVVYGHRVLIDENDRQIGRWMMPTHNDQVLSWADYIPQETLFWRRRIWDKAGAKVDESFRFAMDWDLLVRFRAAGARFARLPRFLGGFRIHERQKTSAAISDTGSQEMDRIRQRLHGRVPSAIEVRKAVAPYLLKHIATDLGWRIRNTLGASS